MHFNYTNSLLTFPYNPLGPISVVPMSMGNLTGATLYEKTDTLN